MGLAEDDPAAAAALLDIAGVSDAIVAFHAQQAIEKSLKAVLASRGVDFPSRTTSLRSSSCATTPAWTFRLSWTKLTS
ncbi:MAG TPA: HEPN domain-containing protein [Solirubrobacteraceae bacterium]|nr:HEPN domain-containing protein [Solirubrobacteraceae bacterium]